MKKEIIEEEVVKTPEVQIIVLKDDKVVMNISKPAALMVRVRLHPTEDYGDERLDKQIIIFGDAEDGFNGVNELNRAVDDHYFITKK